MPAASPLNGLNSAQRKAVAHGEPCPKKAGARVRCWSSRGGYRQDDDDRAPRGATGAQRSRSCAGDAADFTRRAAHEMRRRSHEIVRESMGDTLGNKAQAMIQRLVWTGTFHSIGNRLLRHYARHLQLDPNYTVIDAPIPPTCSMRSGRSLASPPRSSASRARTPALRSTPGASIRRRP